MARMAGKLGRKPFDPERRRLTLERYLSPRTGMTRAGLPPVPVSTDVDRASKVSEWPLYLNDQLGDCTIAGEGHLFGALSTYACGTEALFADSEVVTVYSRVGGYVPGDEETDNGCVMADVLADARTNGMADTNGEIHKVAAYAALGNPADEELLGQVLEVFGSVYVGINVQQQMMDEFNAGQSWTWTPGAQVVGGHCIVLQRREPEPGSAPLEYITWGAVQPATTQFQAYAAEEAWAVISHDWLQANGTTVDGLDLQQLMVDMHSL
jgi:hypothetical protein